MKVASREIQDYFDMKGWNHQIKAGEHIVQTCPFCNDSKAHFYMSPDYGLFHCKKCDEKGNLLSLKRRLGDLPPVSTFREQKSNFKIVDLSVVEHYHRALLNNQAALDYLTKGRSFTLDTIKKFKLGLKNDSIAIPYLENGTCTNIKFRSIKDKKYYRQEDCDSTLFNIERIRAARELREVFLLEGEFDCLALDQFGFPNTLSLPNGAMAFKDEWIDDLERFDPIYLCFDNDEQGQKGALAIADRLGEYRCRNVQLPLKDVNDCLVAEYTKEDITKFIAKAKPFEYELLKSPSHYSEELDGLFRQKEINKGIPTGWKALDRLWGGLRNGELTVVTGETAGGKSTWCVNLGYNHLVKNLPVLFASFEMKPASLLQKMISIKSSKSFFGGMAENEYQMARDFVFKLPVCFVDKYGEMGLKELKDAIQYAKRRYCITLAVIDHLHFFLKFNPDHERLTIDQALKELKALAMDINIPIILVVHPTKLANDNSLVTLNDLKGSSGLKQIPDNVLSIWRDKNLQTREISINLLKVRSDAGSEGCVELFFNKESQKYVEAMEDSSVPAK